MRVLRGVVYMTKSSGPRTEPWGTTQEEVCQEDSSVSHFTRKQRDDRYDLPNVHVYRHIKLASRHVASLRAGLTLTTYCADRRK